MNREKRGLGLTYLLILKELSCKCYGEDILLASKEAKCQNRRIRPNFSIVYRVCHSSSWSLIYSQIGFSNQSQLKRVPECSPGTLGLMTTASHLQIFSIPIKGAKSIGTKKPLVFSINIDTKLLIVFVILSLLILFLKLFLGQFISSYGSFFYCFLYCS